MRRIDECKGRATGAGIDAFDSMTQSAQAGANVMPAVCDVSVTNVCNAGCSFCSFSGDKRLVPPLLLG